MRFRQACSTIARALETLAEGKDEDSYSSALCTLLGYIERPESGLPGTPTFRQEVAALCRMAGVTAKHVQQLEAHIDSELYGTGCMYLTEKWGVHGSSLVKLHARCAWLRTLGRTKPARAQ